jgi:citrate lyase beta subunit
VSTLFVARSLLFAPADDERKLASAFRSKADAVVADLEDGVATARKDMARHALATLPDVARPLRAARIAPDEPRDLEAIAGVKLDAVVVAKATMEALHGLATVRPPLVALIETARGIREAFEIAAHQQVAALMLGSLDLAIDLRLRRRADGQELLFARSTLVLASAAASIRPPFDGVHSAIADSPELFAEVELVRDLGFGGKGCIHPHQIAAVNQGFAPTAAELEWAGAVLAAWEHARTDGRGAISLRGELVDRPVYLRALALIEESKGGTRGSGSV